MRESVAGALQSVMVFCLDSLVIGSPYLCNRHTQVLGDMELVLYEPRVQSLVCYGIRIGRQHRGGRGLDHLLLLDRQILEGLLRVGLNSLGGNVQAAGTADGGDDGDVAVPFPNLFSAMPT